MFFLTVSYRCSYRCSPEINPDGPGALRMHVTSSSNILSFDADGPTMAPVAGLAENAPHGCHGKRAWLREMNSWRLCPGLTGNSNMSAWKCMKMCHQFFFVGIVWNSDDQRENFWMFPSKQRQRLLAFRISHVSPEQRKCGRDATRCDEIPRFVKKMCKW